MIRLVLPISVVETGLPDRKQTGRSDIEEIRSLGFMAVVNIIFALQIRYIHIVWYSLYFWQVLM
jgi:hypothetical protein